MPDRRRLDFASLDDVMPDVDRLLTGYEKAGNWSLGQVAFHLSRALTMTVEGGPRRSSWIVRTFIGPIARWYIFRTGKLPTGYKVPVAKLVPPAGVDDRAESEALRGRSASSWPSRARSRRVIRCSVE